MNGLRECKTAAEIFANYKSVRARIMALKPPPAKPRPAAPIVRKIQIVEHTQDTRIMVHQQEAEPVCKHPSIDRIIRTVCERYEKVTRTDLVSARRNGYIMRPRHIVMYLAKRLTMRSLPEIGRAIGGRDHTTIINGIRNITRRRAIDPELDAELTELESILGGGND